METHAERWQSIQGSEPCRLSASAIDVGLDPIKVNPGRMIDHFRRGVRDLESIWQTMFDRADLEQLKRPRPRPTAFAIDDEFWVRLVYDLAAAYHRRVSERDALVRSDAAALHGARGLVCHGDGRRRCRAGRDQDRAAVRDLRAAERLPARALGDRLTVPGCAGTEARSADEHEQGRMTCGKSFNRCSRRPGSSSRPVPRVAPERARGLLFLAIGTALAVLAGRVAKFLLRRSAVERRANRLGLSSWLERAGILSATAVVVRLVQVVFAMMTAALVLYSLDAALASDLTRGSSCTC